MKVRCVVPATIRTGQSGQLVGLNPLPDEVIDSICNVNALRTVLSWYGICDKPAKDPSDYYII